LTSCSSTRYHGICTNTSRLSSDILVASERQHVSAIGAAVSLHRRNRSVTVGTSSTARIKSSACTACATRSACATVATSLGSARTAISTERGQLRYIGAMAPSELTKRPPGTFNLQNFLACLRDIVDVFRRTQACSPLTIDDHFGDLGLFHSSRILRILDILNFFISIISDVGKFVPKLGDAVKRCLVRRRFDGVFFGDLKGLLGATTKCTLNVFSRFSFLTLQSGVRSGLQRVINVI
jgi:hypothetical protein